MPKHFQRKNKPVLTFFLVVPISLLVTAQPGSLSSHAEKQYSGKGLFETEELIEITITGNIRTMLADRDVVSHFHPMVFSFKQDSTTISIPIEMRTRGHFRKLRKNCVYPPLLIRFSKNDLHKSTVFHEQNDLKLTVPCQDENYVVNEWLVYKIYNLVTEKSFRVRLVKVKMEDTKNKKTIGPFYGFLLEEHAQMARRNDQLAISRKLAPRQIEPESFLNMAVFEYLIGNTDWSIQYLQNIKLLAKDSLGVPTAVPYDFDLAGIVNASYAKPAEELLLATVRTRRYRGYCITDMSEFNNSVALFNRLKKEIYAIYETCPLLDEKYKKSTAKFLDEFYETINNPKYLKREFGYPCDKTGTGDVVIKGLRETE